MYVAHIFTVIGFIFCVLLLIIVISSSIYIYFIDKRQKQHPVLRNYPLIGRARYFLETIGPELRQYLFDNDREGRPLSRIDFQHIVRKAKYKRDVIGFGTRKDFDEPGYYIKNALFPKLQQELKVDLNQKVLTHRYLLINEPLFMRRKEKLEKHQALAYVLHDEDVIKIGKHVKYPFFVKGQIGMSAMSYGSLGDRAITALSKGLGIATGTWMNTGEGGISEYH